MKNRVHLMLFVVVVFSIVFAGAQQPASLTAAPLTVQESVPAANPQNPGTTTGENSTSIERSTWLDKTAVSLYSFGSVGVPEMEKGNASLFFYNYVAFNYKYAKDRRLSFRPTFNYVSGGVNRFGDRVEENVIADDFHIVWTNYDIGEFMDSKVSGNVRLYLPTGKNSQAQRMIAKTRGELYLEWATAEFSKITYVIKGDVLFHNERAYRNSDIVTDDRGLYVSYPIQTNKFAVLEHFVEYDADLGKYLAFEPQAGFKEEWRYSSDIEGLNDAHSTIFKTSAGFRVRPMKSFDFKLSLENQSRVDSSVPFTYGRPDDNSWLLETNIRL